MSQKTVVLHNVYEERTRQDIRWGGAEHDNHLSPIDWRAKLRQHLLLEPLSTKDDYRLFIEIAAIAVAAAESTKRRLT